MNPTQIITLLDRLPNNPDKAWLEAVVSKAIPNGNITFSVFVCPKFDTSALLSKNIENYMPTDAFVDDLFQQRIPKIKSLLASLSAVGIKPNLNILIGDNDAEVYIFPFMNARVDLTKFCERRNLYLASFRERSESLFGSSVRVNSLGALGVVADSTEPVIDQCDFEDELKFFAWLFSDKGPYKGKLTFAEDVLKMMVLLKFKLYAAQGKFLQKTEGGILLQTEGPGVWLLRTKMLRSGGDKAIPAIYPWIRKEETSK